MKHFVLTCVLAIFASFCASAGDVAPAAKDSQYSGWSPFQLGFFPSIPSYVNDSHVVGIKTGWPVSAGPGSRVDGFESSWAYSGTDTVVGCQASIFMNLAQRLNGFQPAIVLCFCTRSLTGFQASCIMNMAGDLSGVQAGALQIARTIDGVQAGVLGCFAKKVSGTQIGLFAAAEDLDGVQVSLVNVHRTVGDTFFQFGLVNIATADKGAQFGLVNIIKNGKVPFVPFFNVSL